MVLSEQVQAMDAMDILGALLGKKTGSGSRGGNILKDMMAGGRSAPPSPPPRQHPRARQPRTIGEAARSLEDLLNVSNDHHQQRRKSPASQPRRSPPAPAAQQDAMNEQARVLVRAMINAAKSDGQMTRDEQENILSRLDSQEEVDFLRSEFKRPFDVRDFTWSVPRGMEQQVYVISLLTIDLDEQKEAEYLADLAHGLRLDTARCNEIHRELGAPVIFKS